MVGHEAEHVQAHFVGFDAVAEAIAEALAVAVVVEDAPPIVAASGNAIDRALVFNAKRPGHAVRLRGEYPPGNHYLIF